MKANKDIKTLNFRLARIVSSGNVHTLIQIGQTKDIDCISDQIIHTKVPIRGLRD